MYEIDFHKPVRVHFCGIGGVSMSALAELLQSEGFRVSGSDMNESQMTRQLEENGITIRIGQRAENITDDIDLVVYTAAIADDNPELSEARRRGLPVISRAQLLGQLMKNYRCPLAIAGTHGKTTTTSMISEMLMAAGTDPTIHVGGILPSIGGNLRIGGRDYFVSEACEYTDSFLQFFPRISVVLNIEEDHLDYFADIHAIRRSFRKFMELLPEDGLLIINGDIADLDELTGGLRCRVVTFGTDASSDYSPADISFDESGRGQYRLVHDGEDCVVKLGVVGMHNILNSLAALAVTDALDIDRDTALEALRAFHGAARRFELKGKLGGITIMDDYAHHPTEIRTTLTAALNYPHKKLRCVFQPHTYTRTKAFLADFADALSLADEVILADIYAAREKNTIGISSRDLEALMKEKGCNVHYFPYFDDIENHLLTHAEDGDLILTMGAGDIYKVGEKLLGT